MELPHRSRCAIPYDILVAMFGTSVDWALEDEQKAAVLFTFAVLCRVGFFCVLCPKSTPAQFGGACLFWLEHVRVVK